MITFAICDDEPSMVSEISHHLSAYLEEKGLTDYRVSGFSSGSGLLADRCDFDVVFLDIRMERPDGMETARLLRQRNCRGLLIFVTALEEYVFDAFAVEAYDYLIKPLNPSRFRQTMDRAVNALARRAERNVVLRRGTSCEVVPLSQITYCEVQGRKIYIHSADGKITDCYDRLEAFERRVDGRFFRCHRSYLVNLDYVRGCGAGQVKLPQDIKIPVSRLRERELTQALLRHMKEGAF